ncbi:MAG: ribosome maturation factor RimP [Clostridium sp.]|nr:ribosome maturation factor RimP [Clostridium sp.]MCM1547477.1 ribosome maturation factor RimP [Ruminococcus sp.]
MKIKKFGPTEQTVFDLIKEEADSQGLKIWDVRFEKEGAGWYLRIFIEKDGGISIEDCENFTRPVNKLLDDADPISQSYMLEIGSAGLEYELLREAHFEAGKGMPVRVRAIRDFGGEKEIVGLLGGHDKESVTIVFPAETQEEDDACVQLPLADIAYIKNYIDFEEFH